jgi:hypothetical protein
MQPKQFAASGKFCYLISAIFFIFALAIGANVRVVAPSTIRKYSNVVLFNVKFSHLRADMPAIII